MNYIKRSNTGVEIGINKNIVQMDIGLVKYINDLCLEYGSTLEGRIKSFKKNYGILNNTPILVNNQIALIPLKSIRKYDSVLINYFEVFRIEKMEGNVLVYYHDNTTLEVDISFTLLTKKMKLIEDILFNIKYKTLSTKKKVFTLPLY